MQPQRSLRVAVVGVCAAGKSTLVAALRKDGYEARHVAQEHSHVPDLWQRNGRPDVLVYLDASYETIQVRRAQTLFRPEDLREQRRRLAHARAHCDLLINTSRLDATDVVAQVLAFLSKRAASSK